jgi:predicted metal-binding membrane protein
MEQATLLEVVLKRDRIVVAAGLGGVVAVAWAYVFYLAWYMRGMAMNSLDATMAMPLMQSWSIMDFGLMFIMWAVMMVAMMVPTAAPMILLFAMVNRRRQEEQRPFVPTAVFLLGYVLVWSGFAALAALAQWGLHTATLLSPMMVSTSPFLGGTLLLAAGIYQWTPLKYVCLSHCRAPLVFLMSEWREGHRGALLMGLRHGLFCLGCCWILMGLLFVLGVMNLLWIAALAGFILLEKVAPRGQWLGRLTGVLLIGWGAWMIVGPLTFF